MAALQRKDKQLRQMIQYLHDGGLPGLELPRTVKLSLWQNCRLRQIIDQGDYAVNLKLVHGGRAVYLAKAKFGQFEREVGAPTNHRNDYPTIHGPEYI